MQQSPIADFAAFSVKLPPSWNAAVRHPRCGSIKQQQRQNTNSEADDQAADDEGSLRLTGAERGRGRERPNPVPSKYDFSSSQLQQTERRPGKKLRNIKADG